MFSYLLYILEAVGVLLILLILGILVERLINKFYNWIIKKYKLSDWYWDRVLTKEQLSFFRKTFRYEENVLVEDLADEYRDANICKELVAINILIPYWDDRRYARSNRVSSKKVKGYMVNPVNKDATFLKEKVRREMMECDIRSRTKGFPLKGEKEWEH